MKNALIMQFSDLHLSQDIPQTVVNWEHCLRLVEREKPDLVVVSGDVVMDNPDDETAHEFSRLQLARIPANWRMVPGNHDLGDSADQPYQGQAITDQRRGRFLEVHGVDRWSMEIGNWKILGINSMLLASGLTAEIEQAKWLQEEAHTSDGPILLFLHKPLCLDNLNEGDMPGWVVPAEGRLAFAEIMQGSDLRVVGSGHLHCHRHVVDDAFEMVWAPATCIVHSATVKGVPKTTGWVSYRLNGDNIDWQHHDDQDLQPIDVTDILKQFGTLRSTPQTMLRGLTSTAKRSFVHG